MLEDQAAALLEANQGASKWRQEIQNRETMVLAMQAERDHLVQLLSQQTALVTAAAVVPKPTTPAAGGGQADLLDGKTPEEVFELLRSKEDESERMQHYIDQVTNLIMDRAPELLSELQRKTARLQRSSSRRSLGGKGGSRRERDGSTRVARGSRDRESLRRRRLDRASKTGSTVQEPAADTLTVPEDNIVTSQEDGSS